MPSFSLAVLGACVGSFLNVCIDRIPACLSLAYPPSHCDACGHRLRPRDLVPVFSYIFLRGRCRYCQQALKIRVLWLEIGGAVLLPVLYFRFGIGATLVVYAVYCALLAVIGVIDLETRLIPNRIIYPAALAVVVLDIFMPQPGIISALEGGLAGMALLLIPAFFGGMGFGDAKLAGLIGLMIGLKLTLLALLLAVVMGGLTAIFILLAKIKSRKEAIPFGPFLSIATLIALLWGSDLLHLYQGLFG